MAANLSTEEEYNNLPLGLGDYRPTWRDFGRVTRDDVNDLCDRHKFNYAQRFAVLGVWNRHPDRVGMFLFLARF